jgi:hypothetical protein
MFSFQKWLTAQRKNGWSRRAYPLQVDVLESRLSPAVITVNSTADNTTADNFLTLREAMQVADGTLGRALTEGEQALVEGTPSGPAL